MSADPVESPAGHPFDEALLPFWEMVGDFVSGSGRGVGGESGELRTEEVLLDLPVELELRVAEDGSVRIGGAPPTQRIRTSVMPVFHRMRLRVVRGEPRGGEARG